MQEAGGTAVAEQSESVAAGMVRQASMTQEVM
jgi:hypothetical protein